MQKEAHFTAGKGQKATPAAKGEDAGSKRKRGRNFRPARRRRAGRVKNIFYACAFRAKRPPSVKKANAFCVRKGAFWGETNFAGK